MIQHRIFRADNFRNKKSKHNCGSRKQAKIENMMSGYIEAYNAGRINEIPDCYYGKHGYRWLIKFFHSVEKKYRINLSKWNRESVAARTFCVGILPWAIFLNYHRQKYITRRSLIKFKYLFNERIKL